MIEKIFKAYDVRATYPNPLNEEAAWKVGHATGQYLLRSRQSAKPENRVKMENTVAIGRDMRPHSPELAKSLSDGLRSTGLSVIDVGMIDTSFMYFAINHLDCVGSAMIEADQREIGNAAPAPADESPRGRPRHQRRGGSRTLPARTALAVASTGPSTGPSCAARQHLAAIASR